jgi:hypothetical protein
MLALLAYALPKRGIRLWMRRRSTSRPSVDVGGSGARAPETPAPPKAASVVRPQLQAHLALGLITAGLALAHARPRLGGGHGGALMTALLATSIAGGLAALAYRIVPPRLARLERTASLPEDFAKAQQALFDRLYRDASGKSDLVKKIFEKLLLPYVRAPLGPILLIASGRRLREEEAALHARIDAVLEGRGKERLAGLAELTRTVVELRALPAQRWLLAALRLGLPVHIVSFAIAVALLVLHVALAIGSRP